LKNCNPNCPYFT